MTVRICVAFLGFCREIDKTALFRVTTQRVVVSSYRRFGTTYRSNLQWSKIKTPWPHEDGTGRLPKTSVRNDHYSLCNNPEQRRSAVWTLQNSTFCPHTVFMCFVWISQQTAIISLYNINCFNTRDAVCLLRGTDWNCIYYSKYTYDWHINYSLWNQVFSTLTAISALLPCFTRP